MAVIKRKADSIDSVVASVGQVAGVIVRHDLGEGAAVSYLFDGDSDRPWTCQWRIIAATDEQLKVIVGRLCASLDRCGVAFDPPRFSGSICHFEDRGPWPADRAGIK